MVGLVPLRSYLGARDEEEARGQKEGHVCSGSSLQSSLECEVIRTCWLPAVGSNSHSGELGPTGYGM